MGDAPAQLYTYKIGGQTFEWLSNGFLHTSANISSVGVFFTLTVQRRLLHRRIYPFVAASGNVKCTVNFILNGKIVTQLPYTLWNPPAANIGLSEAVSGSFGLGNMTTIMPSNMVVIQDYSGAYYRLSPFEVDVEADSIQFELHKLGGGSTVNAYYLGVYSAN